MAYIESEIRWGTGYDNALSFAHPQVFDDAKTYRRPAPGSRQTRNGAGTTDAWIKNRDFILKGRARHFKPSAWGGVGLQDFIDWASEGNSFRFIPNDDYPNFYVDNCYLDQPFDDPEPQIEESDGWQSIDIVIRQQAFDFGLALRGLMFEYIPQKSITDPSSMLATYTRATVAKYHSRALGVAAAASGALRDRHFVGSTKTTLLEQSRENAWTFSEDLSNAAWTLFDFTVSANATTAPDGAATADKLVESAAVGVVHQLERAGAGGTDDTAQSFSFFAKQAGRSVITVQARRKDGTFPQIRVDLTTGEVTTVTAGFTTAVFALGTGWYRICCSFNALSGGSALTAFIETYNGARSYTGDGTSGVYVWGLQWETDATVSSAYIATAAAAVTRNADSLHFPWSFVPQVMTVYVKWTELGSSLLSSQPRILEISDGATSESAFMLYVVSAGTLSCYHDSDAGAAVNSQATTDSAVLSDTLEARGVLNSDGSVLIGRSKNSATEATGSTSSALSLSPTWSGTRLYLGSGGATGLIGLQHVKVAPGVKTMAEMRAA